MGQFSWQALKLKQWGFLARLGFLAQSRALVFPV